MARTSRLCLELMQHQQDTMRHVDEILRVKRTVALENQANHVKSKSEEYWIGLADGANTMLENALHRTKCYAGFQYQASKPQKTDVGLHYPTILSSDPDYAGWRRVYNIRGR